MNGEQKRKKIEQYRNLNFWFSILYLVGLLLAGIWLFRGGEGKYGVAIAVLFLLFSFIGKRVIRRKYSDAVMDLREYNAFSHFLKDYEKPEKPSDEASFLMLLEQLKPLWEKDVIVRELSTGTWRKRRVSIFDASYLTAPGGAKQMAVGTAVAVEGKKSRDAFYEWSEGEAVTPDVEGTEGIDRILKTISKKSGIDLHCAAKNNRIVFFLRGRIMGSSAYKPAKKTDERIFSASPLPELDDFLMAAEIWDRGQEEQEQSGNTGEQEEV